MEKENRHKCLADEHSEQSGQPREAVPETSLDTGAMAAILGSTLDAVITIDAEQRILLFNTAAERMFGWPAEQVIGRSVDQLLPRRLRALHRRHIRHFVASGRTQRRSGHSMEITGIQANGEEFPIDAAISRVETDGQRLFTVVLRDITERKRAEADREARLQAEAASRAKSLFLATMSHELRTPLNAILGYAQLLRRETGLSERQARGLDTIQASGWHLLTLISGLLDFSRMEAGKLELQPVPVNLAASLGLVVDIARLRAAEKNLGFSYTPAPDLPLGVQADEQRLRQVLLNLLGNAVKFTLQGEIAFRVERLGTAADPVRLRFTVTDTGIGIAAEAREAIFHPFERVGQAGARIEGVGLGLAIARQLVRLMGSEIEVESRPGGGSRFWFEVNLPTVDDIPEAPSSPVPSAADLRAGRTNDLPAEPAGAGPLVIPPATELEALHRLARIGDMRDIRKRAAHLVELDERYGPFAERLQTLASSYQSKAILALIERLVQAQGKGETELPQGRE